MRRFCPVIVLVLAHTLYAPQTAAARADEGDAAKANLTCHPAVAKDRPLYIVGYGSLMQEASKARTTRDAGKNMPVRVTGFERGWVMRGTIYSQTTYLGVVKDKEAAMNAAIYSVTAAEVAATDKRETNYCRAVVNPDDVELLGGKLDEDPQIWIYVVPDAMVNIPTPDYPIVQSYVDIMIKGCMELEENYKLTGFAEECISTTSHWSPHWVNDRPMPRRPFIFEKKAVRIDKLLRKNLQQYFDKRQIE